MNAFTSSSDTAAPMARALASASSGGSGTPGARGARMPRMEPPELASSPPRLAFSRSEKPESSCFGRVFEVFNFTMNPTTLLGASTFSRCPAVPRTRSAVPLGTSATTAAEADSPSRIVALVTDT